MPISAQAARTMPRPQTLSAIELVHLAELPPVQLPRVDYFAWSVASSVIVAAAQ